jgi:hypothetical protein
MFEEVSQPKLGMWIRRQDRKSEVEPADVALPWVEA